MKTKAALAAIMIGLLLGVLSAPKALAIEPPADPWRLYCLTYEEGGNYTSEDEGEACDMHVSGFDVYLNELVEGALVPGDVAEIFPQGNLGTWDPLVEPDGEWDTHFVWPGDMGFPNDEYIYDVALAADPGGGNAPDIDHSPNYNSGMIELDHPDYGADTVHLYIRVTGIEQIVDGRMTLRIYFDMTVIDNPAKTGQNGLPDFRLFDRKKFSFTVVKQSETSGT